MDERIEGTSYGRIGPLAPCAYAPFALGLMLDGDRVVSADVEIGFSHRGFEKEAESRGWQQAVVLAERLNGQSPGIGAVGICIAIERLLGLAVPRRAKCMRTILCEAWRICEHLLVASRCWRAIGSRSFASNLFRARSALVDWIERSFGSRGGGARIGGMAQDMRAAGAFTMSARLESVRRAVRDAKELAESDRIFSGRARGLAAISEEAACAWGITGPCLRAAGAPYDVRRACTHLIYDELDWEIPLGSEGDAYDRIAVRLEETLQSADIMQRALCSMEPGPVMADARDVVPPPKYEVYGSTDGAARHFRIVADGIRPPEGELYSCVEGANGELGFYAVSDGGDTPYRLRGVFPSFSICAAVPELIKGSAVEDVPLALASLGVSAGELDR